MANNRIILKRTNTSGRTPNTTASHATNSQYISAGELAINMADGILFSSNGSSLIEVGANNRTQTITTNNLTVGNSLYVVANGYVGISTDSPLRPLHIAYTTGVAAANLITSDAFIITAENTAPGFSIISSANSASSRAVFKGVRSRGSLSSPTAANTNDSVISMLGAVFDGNTGLATAAIDMVVDGSVSVGVAPQRIAFLTGNTNSRTERMRIDSSGNVGIGTTSPSERLHVNSGAAEFAIQWDSTGSNSWILGSATNRAYIRNKTSGAEVLTILNGGNVGIGTTTAAQALQVNSAIRTTAGGTNSIAEMRGGNIDGAVLQLFRAANTSQFAAFSQFQGSLFIKNVDTGPVIFTTTTSDTERMRITSAGDVGIGNTAPNAKLQVTGTANVSGNVAVGDNLTLSQNKALRFTTVNTAAAAYFIQQNDDNFVFYTTNTSYGARAVFSIYANTNNGELSFSVPVRFNANVVTLTANGSTGSAGQVLTSNGTSVYWSSSGAGSVTSVGSGNGLTGGPITTSGSLSVLANNGLSANATGIYVVPGNGLVTANSTGVHVGAGSGISVNSTAVAVRANTGLVANATGLYVNAAYINTISSNSATFANSSVTNTFTVGTASYFVANGNLGIGTLDPSNRLTVVKAAGASVGGEAYFTDGTYWTQFNSRSSAGAYNPLVQAGDHTIIYSDGTSNTGGLVIGQWSSASRGIRIDASGNVGIGTSSPWNSVSVSGTGTAGDLSSARQLGIGAGSTYQLAVGYHQSGVGLPFAGVIQALDNNNGTYLSLNPSGGNIGIGTSTPGYKLVVADNANTALVSQFVNSNTGTGTGITQQYLVGPDRYVNINTNYNAQYYQTIGSGITSSYVDFDTQWFRNNAGTVRMVITSSGDVGIGNTAPNAKLQVTGNANVSGNVVIGGTLATLSTVTAAGFISTPVAGEGGQIIFRNPDNASDGLIVDIVTSNVGRIFQTAANSVLQIGQLASTGGVVDIYTAGSVRIRADASGNVGIGNTTPNARLQVTGTANVSGNVAIAGITTVTANLVIGNTTTNNNALLISQIGISNPNSFTGGTLTTVNSLNTLVVGPYTVAAGNTLNIVAGSRLVII